MTFVTGLALRLGGLRRDACLARAFYRWESVSACAVLELSLALVRDKLSVIDLGRAVQVDPVKPVLEAPGTILLKLSCDGPLSNVAFRFNLRRHSWARWRWRYRRTAGCGRDWQKMQKTA
jgi:hypothetical protein